LSENIKSKGKAMKRMNREQAKGKRERLGGGRGGYGEYKT
jgi:hypothetical protein